MRDSKMRVSWLTSALLGGAVTAVNALPTITAVGNKFFTSDGNQFYIKGMPSLPDIVFEPLMLTWSRNRVSVDPRFVALPGGRGMSDLRLTHSANR